MRRGRLERNDVNALSYTVDISRVGRVPERSAVSHVGLRGHQQLKRDILGAGWVVDKLGRDITLLELRTETSRVGLNTSKLIVLLSGIRWDGGVWSRMGLRPSRSLVLVGRIGRQGQDVVLRDLLRLSSYGCNLWSLGAGLVCRPV